MDPAEGRSPDRQEHAAAHFGDPADRFVTQVLRLAKIAVAGCELAVCRVDQSQWVVPPARFPVGGELGSAEVDLDGGPCRTAIDLGETVGIGDMAEDKRWPRFAAVASALGTHSLLAVPLPRSRGVLCLYGHRAHAFTPADESQAAILASIVDLEIETGRARARAEDHLADLRGALESREVIGQAQGILMERGRMTARAAFGHLRLASQQLNLKLKDVARAVVETGADPLDAVEGTIIPPTEMARSAAVRRYDVLDTPPDGAFDRIARLAASVCKTPIAIISVVDEDRIWFKARHGIEVEQIKRTPGLCASVILQDDPWIIENAPEDPRALANPLVAGDFGLRFYAGVPLRTYDGFNLGTLCVIDRAPRTVTDEQVAQMKELAELVVSELEIRLAARDAVLKEARLRHRAEAFAALTDERG